MPRRWNVETLEYSSPKNNYTIWLYVVKLIKKAIATKQLFATSVLSSVFHICSSWDEKKIFEIEMTL